MAGPPAITIVTRTQARPRFLERCLDSVLAQSRGDWRQVVVNDGGDSREVERVVGARAKVAAGRVEVRHRAESLGMEAASNAGFEGASTAWLTLLDDDDTWSPDFLSKVLPAAEALGPQVAGVVCRSVTVTERVDGDRLVELERAPTNPGLVAIGLDELTLDNGFTNNAFVFRREAFEQLGGFDEDLRVYGDWDFALRLLLSNELEVLPEALANYHRRAGPVAPNSFQAIPDAAERFRALLVNKWLRGEGGRSPAVGTLLALGRDRREHRQLSLRVSKLFNALHRVRRLPLFHQVDRLLGHDE